jgi:hypothetical protein
VSKPSDIPQDIWDAASAVAGHVYDPDNPANEYVAGLVARAIIAERERCAKITGRVAAEMSGCSIDYASGFIAAAIQGEA